MLWQLKAENQPRHYYHYYDQEDELELNYRKVPITGDLQNNGLLGALHSTLTGVAGAVGDGMEQIGRTASHTLKAVVGESNHNNNDPPQQANDVPLSRANSMPTIPSSHSEPPNSAFLAQNHSELPVSQTSRGRQESGIQPRHIYKGPHQNIHMPRTRAPSQPIEEEREEESNQ